MVSFTWYGQASFGIRREDGLLIVTDPYDPEKAGFRPFPDGADIVIKSSSNDDFHDNDHLVPKKPGATVIDALVVSLDGGKTESHGIEFRAIEALEHVDHPSGHPDQNAMYRFRVEDIEIGHMGDMGNDFSDAQMAFFEGIDVLLGHAGGFPVISLEELQRVVRTVEPRLLIPMHYCTPCYKLQNMYGISEFLKHFPASQVDFAGSCSVEVSSDSLPGETRAIVLENF